MALDRHSTLASCTSTDQHAWWVCRYELEFIEQERLGQGGFGVVVAAINRIDGRRYAVKKIPMTGHDIGSNTLRELAPCQVCITATSSATTRPGVSM